jgi:SAM-dependent methyltransferase
LAAGAVDIVALVSVPLERLLPLLRSPRSLKPLEWRDGDLSTADGDERYPLAQGIPILIDGGRSVFSIEDFLSTDAAPRGTVLRLRRLAERLLPSVSHNLAARENYRRLGAALARHDDGSRARVLVIGGSVAGVGFEELLRGPEIELVETDVAFGPRTDLICDGHALPFADGAFDAVVCQAVLEHVVDPPRVVEEIWRVLAPGGLVYSEIPFMQQVHEGAYDFTRYTMIGHRRLYRRFEALHWGAIGGPGMALAWATVYFARALAGSRSTLADFFAAIARLLTFWLKYFDRLLLRTPAGMDAASGTFLLGRKSADTIDDRALIQRAGGREGGHLIWRA